MKMLQFLITVPIALGLAWLLHDMPEPLPIVAILLCAYSIWELWHLTRPDPLKKTPVVKFGPLSWSEEDFLRGWLMTGVTGCGKTASGLTTMMFQITKNRPNWGGVAVDDKGLLYSIFVRLFRHFKQDKLRLLQVRPDNAPYDWKPRETINFLEDTTIPYSAHAKMLVDVAQSFGKSDNPFYPNQAQIWIEAAMRLLALNSEPVTFQTIYEVLTDDSALHRSFVTLSKCRVHWKTKLADLMCRKDGSKEEIHILRRGLSDADELENEFETKFRKMPAETLGNIRATIISYLKYFINRDIAEIFCPTKGTTSIRDVDAGKVLCISVPQKYQVERRYVNTLAKQYLYLHMLRRFDDEKSLKSKNILLFVADEAQRIVSPGDSGMSDEAIVDRIREARGTGIYITQSHISFLPAFRDDKKAEVFMTNLSNRITYKASDEKSALMAADQIGKREVTKTNFSHSNRNKPEY